MFCEESFLPVLNIVYRSLFWDGPTVIYKNLANTIHISRVAGAPENAVMRDICHCSREIIICYCFTIILRVFNETLSNSQNGLNLLYFYISNV